MTKLPCADDTCQSYPPFTGEWINYPCQLSKLSYCFCKISGRNRRGTAHVAVRSSVQPQPCVRARRRGRVRGPCQWNPNRFARVRPTFRRDPCRFCAPTDAPARARGDPGGRVRDANPARLAADPADIPDIHPNIAIVYRRKVERLAEALADPRDRDVAASAIRGPIERIVLTPREKCGEMHAALHGDLGTIVERAGTASRKRAIDIPRNGMPVSVVTGQDLNLQPSG